MSKIKDLLNDLKSVFSASVIPIALIVSIIIFKSVMGDPANFQGNDPANSPIPGNYLGTIYKGGIIVPILMCLLLTVLTFSIERYFAIRKASGKGNVLKFIQNIKHLLSRDQLDNAKRLCDRQKGSVANVIHSEMGGSPGLIYYEQAGK